MKSKLRWFLVPIIFSTVLTPTAQAAELRGFVAIQNMIDYRIWAPTQNFSFTRYQMSEGLLTLMGSWDNLFEQRIFRNGTPNSVNMLLWYLNLDLLADEISGQCVSSKNLFNSNFTEILQVLCQWPASKGNGQVLLNFWIALMGYDAPEEEFMAWKEFFLTSSYQSRSAQEVVRAMALAIMMNPYFLLQN